MGPCRRRTRRAVVAARPRRRQRPAPAAVEQYGAAQGRRRASRSAGSTSATCWPSTTPRRTSWTSWTSASAHGRSETAFNELDVFYAGKAFLCTTVAGWIQEEGLNLDVCSPGELTVALRAGFDPATSATTATTRPTPSCAGRCTPGRADHRGLVPGDRAAGGDLRDRVEALRRPAERDGARDGRGRGAHPRVHRHGARGPEVRVLDHQRRRVAGGHHGRGGRGPQPPRPALPHRLADLRQLGVRGRGPPGAGAAQAGSATSSA